MGVQNRNAPDIKFSVAKMEVLWRLLSLQKANECTVQSRNSEKPRPFGRTGEKELGACTGQSMVLRSRIRTVRAVRVPALGASFVLRVPAGLHRNGVEVLIL